jgi:hypothetical protein
LLIFEGLASLLPLATDSHQHSKITSQQSSIKRQTQTAGSVRFPEGGIFGAMGW